MLKAIKKYVADNERKHKALYGAAELAHSQEKLMKELPVGIKRLAFSNAKGAQCSLTLLNDDITPMEYVVLVFMGVFEMSSADAIRKMLEVHESGQGVVCKNIGNSEAAKLVVYLEEHAGSKGYPLKWVVEDAVRD